MCYLLSKHQICGKIIVSLTIGVVDNHSIDLFISSKMFESTSTMESSKAMKIESSHIYKYLLAPPQIDNLNGRNCFKWPEHVRVT